MVKLAPTYYRKLDLAFIDIGRYHELPVWRKDFKAAWKKRRKQLLCFPLTKNTVLILIDGFVPAHNSSWTIFSFASTWSNLSIPFILFSSLKSNEIAPCQFGRIDLSSPYLMIIQIMQ
jgi:hypothetical protein